MRIGLRLVLLGLILSGASLVLGYRLFHVPLATPAHPLTGRPFAGLATNSAWMDRTNRDAEEQPERALDLIGISHGMIVADVGAGSGYMTLRLSQRVGRTGRVFANDVQADLLAIIRAKVDGAHISNVVLVQGTPTDAGLPADAIDVILMVDVYHEFSRPQEMLRSLRRALKPDGRLILVEYRGEDPTIPILPSHRLSVADARTEVEAEQFVFEQLISALPRQHILVFRRRN